MICSNCGSQLGENVTPHECRAEDLIPRRQNQIVLIDNNGTFWLKTYKATTTGAESVESTIKVNAKGEPI